MNSLVLILLASLIFGYETKEDSNEEINEGASSSKDQREVLSEQEKYEIECYFEQFIRLFVSDNMFDADRYRDYRLRSSNAPWGLCNSTGLSVYTDFKNKVKRLVKYGQEDSIHRKPFKLPNYRLRMNYYKSLKKKFMHPYKLNKSYYCRDFSLFWHYTIRNRESIPTNKTTTTSTSSTTVSTISTSTFVPRPKKISPFKSLYRKCKMNALSV